VVAGLERGHARAAFEHDAGAFVAEDGGEEALGIGAGESEGVGVAYAGRLDFDEDFAGPGTFEVDGCDFERIAGLVRDCSFYFHDSCAIPAI